jgi:NitT/TauT family transport system substrate-binding protein
MEWFQKYPIAIVSKKGAGIEIPADLVGRNVGLPGFFGTSYVGYAGLLFANGLEMADVNANDIGFNQVESLLTDQSEAVVVFVNNEPVQLAAQGEAINVINVADYVDMVSNGLITNEKTIADNPELVQQFVRAMVRGLADTLADPEGAYEISKKFVEGLDDSRMNVLEASLKIWQADTLGYTDASSWEKTEETLMQMGLLDAPVKDLAQAYTNAFVLNGE